MTRESQDNVLPFPGEARVNLEALEERCIKYLRQAEPALVPFDRLFEHCRRMEGAAGLGARALHDFLSNHGEINMIQGVPLPESAPGAAPETAPHVILKTRVPSTRALGGLILQELDAMESLLEKSLEEAQAAADHPRAAALEEALARAKALRAKASKL